MFLFKNDKRLIINNQNAKVDKDDPFYSESIFESWSARGDDSDSVKFIKCLKELNVPLKFTASVDLYSDNYVSIESEIYESHVWFERRSEAFRLFETEIRRQNGFRNFDCISNCLLSQ